MSTDAPSSDADELYEIAGMVWISSERSDDGVYVPILTLNADTSIALTDELARRYVDAILAATAEADYGAALVAQATDRMHLSLTTAIHWLVEFREQVPKLVWPPEIPLLLVPAVSAGDGRPFLHVVIQGEPTGLWELADARTHAGNVLESLAVLRLDEVYRDMLIERIGLPKNTAENAVSDLTHYRRDREQS